MGQGVSTAELRLVSWNLHGAPFSKERGQRFERAGRAIRELMPDVVILQEVWSPGDARRIFAALGPGYEPAREPRGWFLIRRSGLLGLVRPGGGWRLHASQFFEFETEASDLKFWEGDGIGNKGVQRIILQRGELQVSVLNTHLQAEYENTNYEAIRADQVRELEEFAQTIARTSPVLVAGDLNTRPDERLYQKILLSWRDLTASTRQSCACGTYLMGDGSDGDWIDYILARKDPAWHIRATSVKLLRSTAPDYPYSDHQGLLATIEITPSRATSFLPPLWALAFGDPSRRMVRHTCLMALALGLLGEGLGLRPGDPEAAQRDAFESSFK